MKISNNQKFFLLVILFISVLFQAQDCIAISLFSKANEENTNSTSDHGIDDESILKSYLASKIK